MSSSAAVEAADVRVLDVATTDDELSVALMDERTIAAPVAWYSGLAGGTDARRANRELAGGGFGIRWPEIGEDLGAEGLLGGWRLQQRRNERAAAG